MANSSDVYMELSDPAVWGETYDEQFGMGKDGRQLGAFEISSFNFDIKDADRVAATTAAPTAARGAQPTARPAAPAAPTPNLDQTFSVSKYIDKSSPDLFLACCMKSPIAWCIISVRETGETRRKPYLVMEFQRLHVKSFTWEDIPGDAESASEMEKVTFSYETVLMKYSKQDITGEHPVVKMKGYDFSSHSRPVTELDHSLQSQQREDF